MLTRPSTVREASGPRAVTLQFEGGSAELVEGELVIHYRGSGCDYDARVAIDGPHAYRVSLSYECDSSASVAISRAGAPGFWLARCCPAGAAREFVDAVHEAIEDGVGGQV